MVKGIQFNDEQFDATDYHNIFGELTENTVVFCRNFDMMKAFAQKIVDTINGKAEYNIYDCGEEDIGRARYDISVYLTTVIKVNNQKITLCLEPAMIYTAKRIEDVWFLDERKVGDNYLWTIDPLAGYKGAKNIWEGGLDSVYAQITIGRYGGYTGEWIDDWRTHVIWI